MPIQEPNGVAGLWNAAGPQRSGRPNPWNGLVVRGLFKGGRAVVLDGASAGHRPIVQVIDNVNRNHKLGLVFEFRVGKGKLLVCTTDLLKLCDRPEAAQLLRSLLAYAASGEFNPSAKIDLATLRKIMGILVVHASLKRRRPEDELYYEKLHLFCRRGLRGHRLLLDLEFSRWRKCPSSGNRKVGFKPPRGFSPELCQDI